MSTEYFGRIEADGKEYCARHDCTKREACRHYETAKRLAPEQAFALHGIEERECGPKNGWLRYWPKEEVKG